MFKNSRVITPVVAVFRSAFTNRHVYFFPRLFGRFVYRTERPCELMDLFLIQSQHNGVRPG